MRRNDSLRDLGFIATMIVMIIIFCNILFSSPKVIHAYVTLADDKQGIISYNHELEDGDDLYHNQYWGALYGVKQFMQKSEHWSLIAMSRSSDQWIERLIFKHMKEDVYLIADAYSGRHKPLKATDGVFRALSGRNKDSLHLDPDVDLGLGSNADLIVYIGHHFFGALDIIDNHNSIDDIERDVILLACVTNEMCDSIDKANANPLLLTKQFMAPEAYILENVLEYWIVNETNSRVTLDLEWAAAEAYSEYQKISMKSARGVFTDTCE